MSRKLLVVEDDAETLGYIRRGFEEAGWSVEQAQDGRDGRRPYRGDHHQHRQSRSL